MKRIYIKRNIEKVLQEVIKTFPVIAVTGSRQTGKSTLLANLLNDKYKVVSFDDPQIRRRAKEDPWLFLEDCGENIIFDEIQYLPEILSYIKILVDKDRHKKGRFVLTGSQQFILMRNLGESLAGRVAILNLCPFSLEEKERVVGLQSIMTDPRKAFIDACIVGSYPELAVDKKVNAQHWYSSYIKTYLERDIRMIYDIGSLDNFERFLFLLAGRTSQVLNLSTFSREIGVSVPTLNKWISVLVASQIIYLLPSYYQNFGKRVTKNPKVYFMDIGLVCYLTGIESDKQVLNGPMPGALFENFIIQETLKQYLHAGRDPRMYYMRTHNGPEIDLIIERNLELHPFEIKLTKTPHKGMASSLERIKKIFNKLVFKNGYIVSLSDETTCLTSTVSTLPINVFIKRIMFL